MSGPTQKKQKQEVIDLTGSDDEVAAPPHQQTPKMATASFSPAYTDRQVNRLNRARQMGDQELWDTIKLEYAPDAGNSFEDEIQLIDNGQAYSVARFYGATPGRDQDATEAQSSSDVPRERAPPKKDNFIIIDGEKVHKTKGHGIVEDGSDASNSAYQQMLWENENDIDSDEENHEPLLPGVNTQFYGEPAPKTQVNRDLEVDTQQAHREPAVQTQQPKLERKVQTRGGEKAGKTKDNFVIIDGEKVHKTKGHVIVEDGSEASNSVYQQMLWENEYEVDSDDEIVHAFSQAPHNQWAAAGSPRCEGCMKLAAQGIDYV